MGATMRRTQARVCLLHQFIYRDGLRISMRLWWEISLRMARHQRLRASRLTGDLNMIGFLGIVTALNLGRRGGRHGGRLFRGTSDAPSVSGEGSFT